MSQSHANRMDTLTGIPAAPGIAIGPAFRFFVEEIQVEKYAITDTTAETARFNHALTTAREQIDEIREQLVKEVGTEDAAIFEAHGLILADPDLIDSVERRIEADRLNVEFIWGEVIEDYAGQMEALESEYFQARAADIRDVGKRVLKVLTGKDDEALHLPDEPIVIMAHDLTPSDTAQLDKSKVLGFVTAAGGPTSHTAILAKSLGLPAVVGVGASLISIKSGTPIMFDGERGEVVVNPDETSLKDYRNRQKLFLERTEKAKKTASEPAITSDGHQVEIVANLGSADEAQIALEFGAEGVGLLRTEFIFLERTTAPDEEEQFQAYKKILDHFGQRPVVVRTLDVGGDKPLAYLDLGEEMNPFLGWRAIRMCLDNPDFFKIQLRALLRASHGNDLRIMFPMIATLDELRQAQKLLSEAREEVTSAGHIIADNVQVGMMVEVPSAVMFADKFAAEVDFFSIGTNDLTQYTMAADRGNEKIAYLTDALHPVILRQIKKVIDAGHKEGIWTGLCGELAGDPFAAPILLGLGLDEFSMAPSSIPRAKEIIRGWSYKKSQQLAREALNQDSGNAVRQLIQNWGSDVRI